MMPSTKGAAVALLIGAAAISLALIEHPLIAAARKEPMMTMGPAGQGGALSAPLSSVLTAQQWLNTQPLRPEDLRGEVVLVNFWTFTCVNWLRTLPYVRAWAEKYKDRGLGGGGVHTPEFSIEKDFANVTRASASLGVGYPVAIDNDYAIWRAFDNYAWPASYFIDAEGRVRHYVFGEGSYDLSERWLQQLLSALDGAPPTSALVTVSPKGPEVSADLENLDSPETYVGYAKARNFLPIGGVSEDAPSLHRPGALLPLNHWSLAGVWTIAGEFATLNDKTGAISYRFHARDVNLVLTAPEGHPVRFRVKIDGAPPAPTTAPTWTPKDPAACRNRAFISLSGKRGRLRIAPSKSNSSTRASAPSSSRSDRATHYTLV